jgi:beta-lactamase regulating signal transducer with metallopeptidase domain
MIETILSLSLRGSLVYLLILGINRLSARGTKCAGRRIWWLIAAASFLIPNPFSRSFFSESWSYLHSEVPSVSTSGGEVASMVSLVGNAGKVMATPVINSLHRAPSIQWLPILWLAGAGISLAIVIVQTLITSYRWSRERLSTNPEILSLLEDCKMEAGITAPIGIVLSNRISAPALLGWLRPRIILPTNLVATFSPEQLRAILFHELAHFKWLDVPSNWLFVLVRAIHWFNPLAYLASSNWAAFREEAADEAAMKWMGGGEGYGETLVAALRQNSGTDIPYGALAIGESLKNLKQRITLIGQYSEKKRHFLMVSFAALAFIALGLVLLPLGLYAAESPSPQFIRDVGTYHLSPEATLTIFTNPADPTGHVHYKYSCVMDKKDWTDSGVKNNSQQAYFEPNKTRGYVGSLMVSLGGPYFFYWDQQAKALWLARPNETTEILLFESTPRFISRPISIYLNKPHPPFEDDYEGKPPQPLIDEIRRVIPARGIWQ